MRVEHADSFFKRLRGLMFRRRPPAAFVFEFPRETRLGACIHSFFVFFEFDAVWLDERMRVVDAQRVKPWRVMVPRRPAKYLIEMPAGAAKKQGIRIGRKIGRKTALRLFSKI